MLTIKHIEGRFGLVRFDDSFAVVDVARMRSLLMELFSVAPLGKIVLLSDLSDVHSIKSDVKQPLTKVLVSDNPRIERNAIWVTKGRPVVIQAHNILDEAAGKSNRKLFTDPAEAEAWLSEVLTPKEQAALKRCIKRA